MWATVNYNRLCLLYIEQFIILAVVLPVTLHVNNKFLSNSLSIESVCVDVHHNHRTRLKVSRLGYFSCFWLSLRTVAAINVKVSGISLW